SNPGRYHRVGGDQWRMEERVAAFGFLFSGTRSAFPAHRSRNQSVSWFLRKVSPALAQGRSRVRHRSDSDWRANHEQSPNGAREFLAREGPAQPGVALTAQGGQLRQANDNCK